MKGISKKIFKKEFIGKEYKLINSCDKYNHGLFEIELSNNIIEYHIYLASNCFSRPKQFMFREHNLFFVTNTAEKFIKCVIGNKDYYYLCYKFSRPEKGKIKFKYNPFLYAWAL